MVPGAWPVAQGRRTRLAAPPRGPPVASYRPHCVRVPRSRFQRLYSPGVVVFPRTHPPHTPSSFSTLRLLSLLSPGRRGRAGRTVASRKLGIDEIMYVRQRAWSESLARRRRFSSRLWYPRLSTFWLEELGTRTTWEDDLHIQDRYRELLWL